MSTISRAALAAALASLSLPGAAQDAPGLVPVEPGEEVLPSLVDERADLWKERLLEPDLDRREQHFDRLIEAARRNPHLRPSLEAWAAGGAEPELAWTARLALRELARQPAWGFQVGPGARGFGPANPWFSDPLEALGSDPAGRGWPDLGSAGPGEGTFGILSLRIEPDGVHAELTQTVDGEERTEHFEAESLEALLEAHPELAQRLPTGPGGFAIGRTHRHGPATPEVAPVRTDVLGVYLRQVSAEEREQLRLAEDVGLLVDDVAEGTIAAVLGLRPGVVLIELNGRALHTRDDVSLALAQRGPLDEVTVVLVDRAGRRRTHTWRSAVGDPFEDL